MKNIVSLRTLKEHWEKSGREDSEQQLKAWYQEVKMDQSQMLGTMHKFSLIDTRKMI